MFKNPLNENLNRQGWSNNDNPMADRAKEEKKKTSKAKSKYNGTLIKETAPFLLWASLTLGLCGGAYYYTNTYDPTYDVEHYSKVKEFPSLQQSIETTANTVGSTNAAVQNASNKLQALKVDLAEQDKVKTPLSQGYYFISYLAYLTDKHGVQLDKLDVIVTDGQGEVDLTQHINLQGDYDLLPIKVKVHGLFDEVKLLLNEMYTKRIIVVNELEVVNSLDGYVEANFTVNFNITDSTLAPTDASVVDPNLGVTPTEPVVGEDGLPIEDGYVPPTDTIGGEPVEGITDNVNTGSNYDENVGEGGGS